MPPFLGGGEMIRDVRLDGFTTNDVPWKFEAGTPPIAEIIGLGAAVDYLQGLGMDAVRDHEVELTAYTLRTLTERFGDDLHIYGPSEPSAARRGVLVHATATCTPRHQSGARPARRVRACRPPLRQAAHAHARLAATARASLYVYNDESDVDRLADALEAAGQFFAI